MNYTELCSFVNDQVNFHKTKVEEFKDRSPERAKRHGVTAANFSLLADWMKQTGVKAEAFDSTAQKLLLMESKLAELEVRKKLSAKPAQLALSFEDVDGLPEELLQELGLSDGDRMDFTIHRTINELGGVTSIDRLLVTIYKDTGEIVKRSNLNQRLYRMAQRGALFAVPGKKGVYSTDELTEDEAAQLR